MSNRNGGHVHSINRLRWGKDGMGKATRRLRKRGKSHKGKTRKGRR